MFRQGEIMDKSLKTYCLRGVLIVALFWLQLNWGVAFYGTVQMPWFLWVFFIQYWLIPQDKTSLVYPWCMGFIEDMLTLSPLGLHAGLFILMACALDYHNNDGNLRHQADGSQLLLALCLLTGFLLFESIAIQWLAYSLHGWGVFGRWLLAMVGTVLLYFLLVLKQSQQPAVLRHPCL